MDVVTIGCRVLNRRKVKWNRAGTCDRNARIELALVLSPKDETARICARLLSHLGEKSLLLQSCLSISKQQFWKDILKILYVQKCRCNYNSCNLRDALRRLCKALMAQLQDVALLACCQLQPVCLQATRHPKLRAENIQSFSRHFTSFQRFWWVLVVLFCARQRLWLLCRETKMSQEFVAFRFPTTCRCRHFYAIMLCRGLADMSIWKSQLAGSSSTESCPVIQCFPGQLLLRGLAADTWQPSASLRWLKLWYTLKSSIDIQSIPGLGDVQSEKVWEKSPKPKDWLRV